MRFLKQINIKQIHSKLSFYKEIIISFTLICLPIIYPTTANAGLFSFLTDATGDKVSAETIDTSSSQNSQNMFVLQAPTNINPNPIKISNDIPLVSNNALIAEIGPSGTVAEIEDENTNTQISLYMVRDGDTLSKIAKMFNVTANTIVWANDLGRNPTLKKDEKLIILPISGIKYTVKKGDTIKGIVSKYKSDLNEVLQFNDLTLASVISVGDIIIIPDAEPVISTEITKFTSKNVGINPLHDADGPSYPGYYIRPVDGGYESQGLHGYNAVDLAVPIGTSIHASASGTVIASLANNGWNGGYGNYVIISHPNGTQTLYAHARKTFVKVGDYVEQGQKIAEVGMTGKTTGPHVHFEIRGAQNPF